MSQPKEQLPLLLGVIAEPGDWKDDPERPGFEVMTAAVVHCWCPYCRRFHVHGWYLKDSPRVHSLRGPHCTEPTSPFLQTSYEIGVFGRKHPLWKSHCIKPGRVRRRRKRRPHRSLVR